MISIYSPKSEDELALILSILGGDGIVVHVQNDFAPIFPASMATPSDSSLRTKTIMVSEEQKERAMELIQDFLKKTTVQKDGSDKLKDLKKLNNFWVVLLVWLIIFSAIMYVFSRWF